MKEKELNWKGICIEPRKEAYNKLIKNRICICENSALSNNEEIVDFMDIKGYGLGLSGIISEYDEKHKKRINKEIKHKDNKGNEIYKIKTKKLCDILDKHNVTKIDFLSIDTEGSELKILETIDFNKVFINIITIEDNYNDKKIINFFEERNYKLIKEIGCDKIFKKI